MKTIKHILLFIKNIVVQVKRKWISLPLLFVFPIIAVGLVITIIASFFYPDEQQPIQIGIVDLDESDETQLVTDLIEESSQLGSYIQVHKMKEKEAQESIGNNEISAYIIFPNKFTKSLYQGHPVELPIVGNPKKQMDSLLIREIIESVSRHIRASQANILTINYFAKELGMNDEQRNELVFEQFKEFVFYTLGSNQIVNERDITNQATTSPFHYFGMGFWFICLSIWLFIIYNYLYTDSHLRMKQRVRLYGVTELQQIIARIIVSMISSLLFCGILFFSIDKLLDFELSVPDYSKGIMLTVLYSITLLGILAIIEVVIVSNKLRLLAQSIVLLMSLVVSGAIIPVIYYPQWLQGLVTYSFTYETFYWLIEMLLNNRIFIDFLPISIMASIAISTLVGISLWKERVID
ncbi:ABC transporter permease [Oceanobacillus halophilus]|uniref:ABC transporter permease n=1 Tax=Oceanobacillus halophilus TaxID=930130 RepID=A0A495AF22_9BACI|nr:ABC transporter permease [Oceanobacillus halophilus]RKQ37964.1 ABC transporter permease [Oceanobacillus halophilus]